MARQCLVCGNEASGFVAIGGNRPLCTHHIADWTLSPEVKRAVQTSENKLARTVVAFQDWRYRLQKESQS